jgi:hypothetical protein
MTSSILLGIESLRVLMSMVHILVMASFSLGTEEMSWLFN